MTHPHPETGIGSTRGGSAPPVVLESSGNLPTTLANVSAARLPSTYEAARKAIEECARSDEVKNGSDKAAALRAYAIMRDDTALRSYADRIHLRAERQCGKLVQEIPRADKSSRDGQEGALPPVTRTQAAADAGLSEHQRKTALRLASIPEPEFNRQVEGTTPPTVTCPAEQGKVTRAAPPAMVSARTLGACSKACEALVQFAQFCERNEPVDLARTINADDIEAMR